MYLQSIITPLHAATEQLGITKKERKRTKPYPSSDKAGVMHAARELETRKKNIPTSKATQETGDRARTKMRARREKEKEKETSHD